jgi:hypothetical protein
VSPQTGQFLGAAIVPLVVMMTLGYLYSSRKTRSRRDMKSGDLILEYGIAFKSLPIVVALVWAVLVPIVLHDDPIGPENLAVFLMVVVVVVVPLVIVTIEAFGVSHRISQKGIEKRSPWSRSWFVEWSEIREVSFSGAMQRFAVECPQGKLRLSFYLNGLKDFADALCANVAREKWRQAEAQLNLLLRAEDLTAQGK